MCYYVYIHWTAGIFVINSLRIEFMKIVIRISINGKGRFFISPFHQFCLLQHCSSLKHNKKFKVSYLKIFNSNRKLETKIVKFW